MARLGALAFSLAFWIALGLIFGWHWVLLVYTILLLTILIGHATSDRPRR